MKRIRKKIIEPGIYKITNPIGEIYIGQTLSLTRRKKEHKAYSESREDGPPDLMESLKKYGFEKHVFEIVCIFPKDITRETLKNFEYFVFNQFKEAGYKMLNLAEGGTGILLNEKSKELISKSAKAMWTPEFRENHIQKRLGKPIHSEEDKKRRSEWMKNNRKNWTGHVFTTDDTAKGVEKRKQLIAERGYFMSQESRRKSRETKGRIILNTQNGIFYYGCKEAADSMSMGEDNLRKKLIGKYKNNTPFIFAQ